MIDQSSEFTNAQKPCQGVFLCCNLERVKTLMDRAKQMHPTLHRGKALNVNWNYKAQTGSYGASSGSSPPLSCASASTVLALEQPWCPAAPGAGHGVPGIHQRVWTQTEMSLRAGPHKGTAVTPTER